MISPLPPSATRPLRWLGAAALAAWSVSIVRDPDGWRFIDGVNLLLHEAGHPLFGVFGELMAVLGGTLMQLLFPLAFAVHFRRSAQPFAASASLAWLGESLFNVARYAADARARALPLLGGDDAGHDWAYLLARFALLHRDQDVARAIRLAGALLLLGAVVAALKAALAPVPAAPAADPLRTEDEALARYLAERSADAPG
ncbi:MAG TPA: hypothetical protein VHG51_07480 [Longimicrobiaceae bacterium]|nr:hypothetical protein [Longimicrobiaceae bacterium]